MIAFVTSALRGPISLIVSGFYVRVASEMIPTSADMIDSDIPPGTARHKSGGETERL